MMKVFAIIVFLKDHDESFFEERRYPYPSGASLAAKEADDFLSEARGRRIQVSLEDATGHCLRFVGHRVPWNWR